MASVDENGVVKLDLVDCIVLDALLNADTYPVDRDSLCALAAVDLRMTEELKPKGVLGPWVGPVLRGLVAVGYVQLYGLSAIPLRDSSHRALKLSATSVSDGHSIFQRLADDAWFCRVELWPTTELWRLGNWGGLFSKYAHEITVQAGWPWLLGRLEAYVRDNHDHLVSGVGLANGMPAWMGLGGEDFVLRRHSRVVDELCQACTTRYWELHGIALSASPGTK